MSSITLSEFASIQTAPDKFPCSKRHGNVVAQVYFIEIIRSLVFGCLLMDKMLNALRRVKQFRASCKFYADATSCLVCMNMQLFSVEGRNPIW